MATARNPEDALSAGIEELLRPHLAAHPGQSGARLLPDGFDAFALRVLTARAAARTLDMQYYIWHSDATGQFLAHELLQAADRGVRVRLLLDDMDARSRDAELVALDRHERIEVRLFNPFATRSGILRTLRELFTRASRLNHRMHNKSWIADRQIALVGGRNIGDEYFAASDDLNFVDLDVLLAGPVVKHASNVFDAYWNYEASVPISKLRRVGHNRWRLSGLRSALRGAARAVRESQYVRCVRESLSLEAQLRGEQQLTWTAQIEVVADDPHKVDRDANRGGPVLPGVFESVASAMDSARRELLLISPYFVPGARGAGKLKQLAGSGVQVGVLTNSLAATDVAVVHSGYSRYRSALLRAGVRLYELKPSVDADEPRRRLRLGSSRASLHTKAVFVDGERIFVGSYNLDPRSMELNCEMGVWIRSVPLARELHAIYAPALTPEVSFIVTLDPNGRPRWLESQDGRTFEYRRDPYAGWGRRSVTWLLQWLPIESQL
jgi:putative cardiolipin synthase